MIQLAGYKILAEVGRGETGIVFKAVGVEEKRLVALKVALPRPGPEQAVRVAHFHCEVEALASLDDPHLPAVYIVSGDPRLPYYTREFVYGSILERRATPGEMQPQQGIAVVAAIASAIQAVHRQGIIHCGLRSANILVGNDGAIKLIGFGRARSLDAAMEALPLDVDLQGLRSLLRWLFAALQLAMPAPLEAICTSAGAASVEEFSRALQHFMRSSAFKALQ